MPVSQYVLKVHSRCDLACDHCYVYEHPDQSWRTRPRAISAATANLAARRIAEHAKAHELPRVQIILHGGEPLLLSRAMMREVLSALVSNITPVATIDLHVHTNGVRLDERWCELFGEYQVRVGVSLDGGRVANDRHRRFRDGRSSHLHALSALALLRRPEFRHLYAGILCTIDLANDPVAAYSALIAERPPRIDFLLPHATWENPPFRPAGQPHPYADWLARVYRRWVRDGCPVPIRLFDSMLSAAGGGPSWTETVGLDPVDLLVIETDGSWEQPDSMKTTFDGAPSTGLRVHSDTVDEAAQHPGVVARQAGLAALCRDCRDCPVVRICGGGLYAHRYRAGTGFDNPSVYCADLKALIGHMTAGAGASRSQPGRRHVVSATAFDALAAGPGDAAGITVLAEMRQSVTRALVAAVASLDRGWRNRDLERVARRGWETLCALDAEHPEAVAEVFAHPYASIWAVRCLRPPPDADIDLDRAHMAGLAAAAAVRAGETACLSLPVRSGLLHLPAIGAFDAGAGSGLPPTMRISVSAGRPAAGDTLIWHQVRTLPGPLFPATLEDLDPFRGCQDWPVAGRLSGAEWMVWRQRLETAWQHLVSMVPAYACALRAGLRSVVPLRPAAAGSCSSTARHAFGAVAVTLPSGPADLGALLVHEFQHVKLNALLDMHELFDGRNARRLKVGWRKDARPVGGVLHGAYAHLALAHLEQARGPAAAAEYRRHRADVCEAIAALSATGALTCRGERFVAAMRASAGGSP